MTKNALLPRRCFRLAPLALLVVAASLLGACVPPTTPAVTLQTDGLDVARFGDTYDSALAALTTRLGPPTDPGRVGGPLTPCVSAFRYVYWGDLQIAFHDTGSGLRFSGLHWGNWSTLNTSSPHAAPAGPGAPTLRNPWNLSLATPVADNQQMAAQVAQTYPGARVVNGAPILDLAVATSIGPRTLNIGLHANPAGGSLVERIWVFDPRDVSCR